MRNYFGSIPAAQGQEFLYILTNGAASVSGADSLGRVLAYANQGLVRVFLNGARLTTGIEYTATNGTTITFVGWTASANDELLIEVLTGLVVADTLRPAQNLADLASATAARTNLGAAALLNPLTTIASATTTDLGSVASQGVEITGTTTITSFGTATAGTVRFGRFTGALTLTHNATSLILPNNGANITTVANDSFEAVSLGSGNWFVRDYQRANGQALVAPAAGAPLPTNSAGVGQRVTISATGFPNTYTLPAGGTWFWFYLLFTDSGGTWVDPGSASNISAGGTQILNFSGLTHVRGFAWRIT